MSGNTSEYLIPRHLIITHSGYFHLDEAMATAFLQLIGAETNVMRTRDAEYIKNNIGSAYIVDVGGVYNPKSMQFDHHQPNFNEYYNDNAREKGIKMSSFGLVYKEYARNFFYSAENGIKNATVEGIESIVDRFYNHYVMEIDAGDNGVSEFVDGYDENRILKYKKHLHLSDIVSAMNGSEVADTGELAKRQDIKFRLAVKMCIDILYEARNRFIAEELDYYIAKYYIRDGPEPEVIEMGNMIGFILYENVNYTRAIEEYMKEERKKGSKKEWVFTILPRERGKNNPQNDMWQVHTVAKDGKKFAHKVDVVAADDAKKYIGNNLVFVHNNKFIGVTKNHDSAKILAERSMMHQLAKEKEISKNILKMSLIGIAATLVVASMAFTALFTR